MMKHQVIINVEKADGEKVPVVKGAIRYLPRKIVEWLFGEYTQVYLNTVPPMGTLNEPYLLQSSSKCGILSP